MAINAIGNSPNVPVNTPVRQNPPAPEASVPASRDVLTLSAPATAASTPAASALQTFEMKVLDVIHSLIAKIKSLLGLTPVTPAPNGQIPPPPPPVPSQNAPTPIPTRAPVPAPIPVPVPVPQPAAPAQAPSSGATQVPAELQQVLDDTNRQRAAAGLSPLSFTPELNRVASDRSKDMVTRHYFEHVDPDGHDPFYHMQQDGVNFMTAGENIAMGQPTANAVVDAWMHSAGHRANILNPNFHHIGIGVARNANGQLYWTQDFTN